MVRADRTKRRFGVQAVVDHQRAARGERASGRQRHQGRRRTRDGHQPRAARGVQPGNRSQKPRGVGHPAVGIELLDGGGLHRAAGVHHQGPIGELGHHAQIVGDDQHGGVGDVARGLENVEDLRLHGDIERGRRLVADDQVRIVRDRHGDHHALAFAAGEFVGECARPLQRLRDADQFQKLHRALAGSGLADVAVVDADGLGDLVTHGVDRRQRRHGVLEHRPDPGTSDRGHLGIAHAEQFLAVQSHRTRHGRVLGQQTDHRHRRGRLP